MICNPLYSAVIAGDQLSVQNLLEHGADPDLGDDNHTPLMQASSCQLFSIMQQLIDAGADINRRDKMGRTALIHALKIHADFPLLVIDNWIREAHTKRYPRELSLQVTSLLISSGSDYQTADNNGFFPADYALLAYLNGAELPPELIPDKVPLRLCKAATTGSSSEVASILATENIPRRLITLALHLAATRGHTQCFAALLKQRGDANGIDIFGFHPIESAAAGLHTPVVLLLIAHGVTSEGLNRALLATCMADSHRWPDEERKTIKSRRLELARWLLEQGANPNYCHEYHDAPLKQVIVREEDCELASLLLEYGADPSARDDHDEPPSTYARTDSMKSILQEWDSNPCQPK